MWTRSVYELDTNADTVFNAIHCPLQVTHQVITAAKIKAHTRSDKVEQQNKFTLVVQKYTLIVYVVSVI